MTACVNRKHTKKVAAVVTASLVGAHSLGVAPVVAMADDGISMQFLDPVGALSDAKVWGIARQGFNDLQVPGANGVITFNYSENQPVSIEYIAINPIGSAFEQDVMMVDPASDEDQFEVAFYNRDSKGNPTGEEITDDLTAVGNYVAVITGVEGTPYAGGKLYIPIDIVAQKVTVGINKTSVDYDATVHNDEFTFTFNGQAVTEGIDYDVYYIVDGHDLKKTADVKAAGKYRAVISGKGEWAGTQVLSPTITVNVLDLSKATIEGLASTGSDEIQNILAIWINGHRFSGDDAIMGELQAHINKTATEAAGSESVWMENGKYVYTVSEKGSNANIDKSQDFDAYKVGNLATFQYDGQAWPTAQVETILTDKDSIWSSWNVTATGDNGLQGGVKYAYDDEIEKFKVYDANGNEINDTTWSKTPGEYTIVYRINEATMNANGYAVGGQAVVNLRVYTAEVDADAKAAVLYDVDNDGTNEVVSSITKTYDGSDLMKDIEVVVMSGNRDLIRTGEAQVKYYDSEGRQVREIVDAGTYTLKVTADDYKLSGTTEMTITVAPVSGPTVTVERFKDHPFFEGDDYTYLPWFKDGWTINALDLVIKDADGNVIPNAMQVYKVTILDSEGNEVKKVTDEGVYTLHFEARNADAANNYGVPADVTFECVKDGNNADGIDHLIFADVKWSDYFADAVSKVNDRNLMHGYAGTLNFGAQDDIKRGDVAIVLMNMASMFGADVDETDAWYVEGVGYKTGFSDVDSESYYAKAILWAKQAGVINGDTGSNTFRPEEKVTRQEFAAMMANFASKYDKGYEAADADALDAVSDGAQVADWAKESVAWAVENGIMGNAGSVWPGQNIKRCDAAGMVFLYALDK